MFSPGRWAAAFVNTAGGDAGEELEILKVLSSWVKKLEGPAGGTKGRRAMFGSSTAKELEKVVSRAAAKAGLGSSPALKKALCFIALLVRKSLFHRTDAVIAGIERELDRRRAIVPVIAESALPIDGDLEARLAEAIKRRTGAKEVRLEKRLNPGLIGGYRLRIGDEVIDASVRLQVQKMAADLAAGFSTGGVEPADGGR